MSLLYTVVFASRCTSNHHRLAVDALRHLQSPDAEAWRTLLLHHHHDYLKGAKAPDEVFKDFKNHVLHVREGEWGGAIEACEEWQRRTVRAIKEKDWAQAAWCAGVMSHYYVDPIQPFHTHQTEEEGVIHRAVEWSFSKSYGTFQRIIEADLGGYPKLERTAGDKWLADMVRAGANASTKHYETIIDHYDHAAGVKDPPSGLDQELKDTIARLVGHAAVGLAQILDRTFEEAGVKPPQMNCGLQAFFLALEVPIQMVLAKIEDVNERKLVTAQYEEFRRTGKVRETLGEDDKVVRALYAAEVSKTPLSSLDAKWPRETGTKAGEGAPDRSAKPVKAKAEPKPKPAPKPAPVAKAAPAPAQKPEAKPQPEATLVAPPPAEAGGKPAQPRPQAAPPTLTLTQTAPPEAEAAKPAAAKAEKAAYMLHPDDPVVDAPSIGPKTARRLESVGVRTVSDLLAVAPATAAVMIDQKHVSARLIAGWQAQARLACTVPNLRSREAQALVACGVEDADELIGADPAALAAEIATWCASDEADRAWGDAALPGAADVAAWAQRAREAQQTPPARPGKKTAAA